MGARPLTPRAAPYRSCRWHDQFFACARSGHSFSRKYPPPSLILRFSPPRGLSSRASCCCYYRRYCRRCRRACRRVVRKIAHPPVRDNIFHAQKENGICSRKLVAENCSTMYRRRSDYAAPGRRVARGKYTRVFCNNIERESRRLKSAHLRKKVRIFSSKFLVCLVTLVEEEYRD